MWYVFVLPTQCSYFGCLCLLNTSGLILVPGIKKAFEWAGPTRYYFLSSKRVSKFHVSCSLPAFSHSLPCLMDFDASFNVEETKMPFTQALLFYGLKASIFVGTGLDQHLRCQKVILKTGLSIFLLTMFR